MSAFVASLIPELRSILEESDLSQVSAKGIRKQLVARGHDAGTIKANRGSIDEEIETIYSELTNNDDPGSPSSADIPLVSHPQSSLPEPLRKPKVKEEVKVENKPILPATSNGQTYNDSDADMAARLQREFDAEGSRGRASRSGGPAKKKPVKRKSKATIDDDENGEPKKKRKGGGGGAFNKEMILSDALAGLVGEPRLSRPQTVKRLWEHIKEHRLQDPSDGRYILCDNAFKSVFNTDKLHMFTMNKILGHHLLDPEEVAGGDTKPVIKADPTVKREQMSAAMIQDSDDDDDED